MLGRSGLHLHLALLITVVVAAPRPLPADNREAWYGRSIYFVVTDRFATGDPHKDASPGCGGADWCGGTLAGVTSRLDYIAGMGFDALWITPVSEQVPWRDNYNGTGYHGYWARDFSRIEPRLGSAADLTLLAAECHRRGMLLMLDIVVNHVGPVHSAAEVAALGHPFNDTTGRPFHQLHRQPSESFEAYLHHPASAFSTGCFPGNFTCPEYDDTVVKQGWFGDLADIRQEDPGTAQYLLAWARALVQTYDIDGLRLDTALYVPDKFLKRLQAEVGVVILAEVTTYNTSFHAGFQRGSTSGSEGGAGLSGILNFPTTMRIGDIFETVPGYYVDPGLGKGFEIIAGLQREYASSGYEDMDLLGNFIDNHDGKRFLHEARGDERVMANALAWAMLWRGIPIVYYGTEQPAVAAASDCRYSMWPHWDPGTAIGALLRRLNLVRLEAGLGAGGVNVRARVVLLHAERRVMVFSRGGLIVVVSNIKSADCGRDHARWTVDIPARRLPDKLVQVVGKPEYEMWDELRGVRLEAIAQNGKGSMRGRVSSGGGDVTVSIGPLDLCAAPFVISFRHRRRHALDRPIARLI